METFVVIKSIGFRLCVLTTDGNWSQNHSQAALLTYEQARGFASEHRAIYCRASSVPSVAFSGAGGANE